MNLFFIIASLSYSLASFSSDFSDLNNGLVTNDSQIIACNFFGTRSEGWYAYPRDNEISLKLGNCDFDNKPECIDLENGKQAWLINGQTAAVDECSNKDVVCSYKGTVNEGWYAYPSQQRSLVSYSFCSVK